jgi:hypothetical protein
MSQSSLLVRALASAKLDAPPALAKERALEAIAKAGVSTGVAASASVAAGSLKAVGVALSAAAIAALGGAYAMHRREPPASKETVVASVTPSESRIAHEGPVSAGAPAERPPVGPSVAAPAAAARPDSCESISLPDEAPAQCSKPNGVPILLEIVNTCSAARVDLYWVNYQCKEVFYKQLEPGETLRQSTFANHPWRIRDHVTHRLVREIATTSDEVADAGGPVDTDFEILPGASIEEPTSLQCSEAGRGIEIDVLNRRNDPVEMYWADEECKEIFKGRIEPGDHWRQRTQTAHRWHVRDATTHALVKDFAPDPHPVAQRGYVTVP